MPSLPSPIASRDRLPSLTGLRFWAAALVVAYHLSLYAGSLPGLTPMVQFGRSGVTFFFILSGFVLAWTYVDARVRFRVFLWRRFARIWPLLAVTSLVAWAILTAAGRGSPLLPGLSSFLLLQAWWPDWSSGANPPAWSLSAEAFFYAVFPAFLALMTWRPKALKGVALVCGALLLVIWGLAGVVAGDQHRWFLDYFPLIRLLQFVMGVAAGVAMKRRLLRAPVSVAVSVGLLFVFHAALIPWASAVEARSPYGALSGSQWFSAPLFLLLIMAAAQADIEGKRSLLSSRWSVRLGHWSFAWYLLHSSLVIGAVALLDVPTGAVVTMLTWALLGVTTLAVSGAAYCLVEAPLEVRLRSWGSATAIITRGTAQKEGDGPSGLVAAHQLAGPDGPHPPYDAEHGGADVTAADLPVVDVGHKRLMVMSSVVNVVGVGAVVALLLAGAGRSAETVSSGSPATAQGAAVVLADPRAAAGLWKLDSAGPLTPTPERARNDVPAAYAADCQVERGDKQTIECVYGDKASDVTVALVGDSKAMQWQETLSDIAEDRGWRLVVITRSACAFAHGTQLNKDGTTYELCERWNTEVLARLRAVKPSLVLVSQGQDESVVDTAAQDLVADSPSMVRDLAARWRALKRTGIPVAVLLNNPGPGQEVYECVAKNPQRLSACSFDGGDETAAVQTKAARAVKGVGIVDMTPLICPGGHCPAVIGDVLVYRQGSHLTQTFVSTLRSALEDQLDRAILRTRPRPAALGSTR